MSDDELVAVYWPCGFLEVDANRQHLEAMDIKCHLEGEQHASIAGSGSFGNAGRWRMRMLVKQEDAERVRKIIEEGEWPRYF